MHDDVFYDLRHRISDKHWKAQAELDKVVLANPKLKKFLPRLKKLRAEIAKLYLELLELDVTPNLYPDASNFNKLTYSSDFAITHSGPRYKALQAATEKQYRKLSAYKAKVTIARKQAQLAEANDTLKIFGQPAIPAGLEDLFKDDED